MLFSSILSCYFEICHKDWIKVVISVAYKKHVNVHVSGMFFCSKMLNFFYFRLVGTWSNSGNAAIMTSIKKAEMFCFKEEERRSTFV